MNTASQRGDIPQVHLAFQNLRSLLRYLLPFGRLRLGRNLSAQRDC